MTHLISVGQEYEAFSVGIRIDKTWVMVTGRERQNINNKYMVR